MATMKLVPSDYDVSSTYLSVSDASSMYDDCDTSDYATVTNTRSGTTSYYLYIKGFDFDSLPSQAVVTNWTVRIRARESGISTSTSYGPKLCHGTSQITSSCDVITTTATTHEFTNVGIDWEDALAYGSNFGIRLNCRRSSRNTTGYMYVYGAEIEVTYTVPVYYDVTLSNSTSATVTVSDTHPLEGDDVTVTASTLSGITVTDNGVDVTSQFVQGLSDSVSQVPESGISTSFTDSGGAFYISSSSTTTDYLEYACGHSAEDPGTETSTNTYVKGNASGNTTTGDAIYSFDFSEIPAGATIDSVSVRAHCARESSTIDSTHVCRVSVYSGSTLKGSAEDVSGTSYHVHTMSSVGTWTRDELQSARFHFTLGYYGGRIAGITWEVAYTVSGYAYVIQAIATDHAIVVSAASQTALYVKQGGSWVPVQAAYRKVSGSWQEVALDQAFQSGVNYKME